MKRGAFVNLLIGITIALLPLYNRICALDFNRTSKDNLLIVICSLLAFLLPSASRRMSKVLYAALFYGLFFIVFNQYNVLSMNVIFQTFYVVSAMCFFAHYYEKHDADSVHYILNGMMVGSIIQSVLATFCYYGIELYPYFVSVFSHIGKISSPGAGKSNTVGSLGNGNLLASYIAMTAIPFLKSKYKWLIVIPAYALFLADSLTANASFILGILYYLNSHKNIIKKWIIYLSSIVAMLVFPFLNLGIDSGRIEGWTKIIKMATLKHWIMGMGVGWFPDQRLIFGNGETYLAQEHNAFLSVFNVFGIIGFLFLLPEFIKFIKTDDKNKIFASILFVAWCNSYSHFTLHQSTVVVIIMVVASVCLAEGNKNGVGMDRFGIKD